MTHFQGTPVYPGIATGPAFIYAPPVPTVGSMPALGGAETSLAAYRRVQQAALRELERLITQLQAVGMQDAAVFLAQQDIINDVEMEQEITAEIRRGVAPDVVIDRVYSKYTDILRRAPDDVIRERAADVEDTRLRLLRLCSGGTQADAALPKLEQPCILVAHELLPSQIATIDRTHILAIVTEAGSVNSHASIIARGYEVPTIVGIQGALEQITAGEQVLVDALRGRVTIEPTAQQLELAQRDKQNHLAMISNAIPFLQSPTSTADGVRIELGLDLSGHDNLDTAPYADRVGILRTEFLYAGKALPTEKQQFQFYRDILKAFSPRPVVLRLLNAGHDTALPVLPGLERPEPGCRGLRFSFAHPDIFKAQVRCALRASIFGNLWLLLPMAGGVDELRRARGLIREVMQEMREEGIAFDERCRVGASIGLPSLALMGNIVAREMDFACIDTDGLARYMTADGGSDTLPSPYSQPLHPAVFRMIAFVAQSFTDEGTPVSVCGALASDFAALTPLLGMGVRSINVAPGVVAAAKQRISAMTLPLAQAAASELMPLATTEDVQEHLNASLTM